MELWILRAAFLATAVGLGVSLGSPDTADPLNNPWSTFAAVVISAFVVVGADIAIARKRIELITCVYFGIIIGLFLTYVVSLVLTPLFENSVNPNKEQMLNAIQLVLGISLCYACISLLIQTKDDFRFIIPYVEFSKEVKGTKSFILDTSVIIDGRIADLVETKVLDSQLIIPRFVLGELQGIADSSDKLRRSRGRRGLDVLNALRTNENVDLKIYDHEHAEMADQPVDMKLVLLAKHLEGKVVTGDYNLNKVAKIHNVSVINLNDIANALKPILLPGEHIDVRIIKAGEEQNQGIGYLDDGTMIVVESARDHIGETVNISVTSVLQTSAGRMIFGRYEGAANKT
ncbi:MAG: TRAM domain-containing protein [Pirellulaceae bacterium]|nr:TRAM domain-containing protein [Pirellulaceae bacterium]